MEQKQIDIQKVFEELSSLRMDVDKVKSLMHDLIFAQRTEEAHKRIEAGEGTEMEFDDFIDEMKKW